MPLPTTLRALKYRNFQLFFAGQLISLVGTWMQNVAQSWLVYRLTGSSVLLGLTSFSGQIPIFLFSVPGGIVADRLSRRHIVIATQTASMLLALALAALTLTHTVRIWHVFVLSALLGVVNAFDIPARQAFIMEMVGREDLINAIALNSAMFNASRVVGPAIAGILVASIGEGWCFFANGVSYIAVIVGLILMTCAAPYADGHHLAFRRGRGRLPLRGAQSADPRPAHRAGNRQPGRHAVRRAHADLRRPDSARRRAGIGLADGLRRHRRRGRGAGAGLPQACPGARPLGSDRGRGLFGRA